jgi:hypothetical protein
MNFVVARIKSVIGKFRLALIDGTLRLNHSLHIAAF